MRDAVGDRQVHGDRRPALTKEEPMQAHFSGDLAIRNLQACVSR